MAGSNAGTESGAGRRFKKGKNCGVFWREF